MVRTPCCEKMGLKKGPWTPEEDQILISYIHQNGHGNWRALPKQAGLLRCGKSCRLRWINYLRPNIKRGNFTREEEETIIKMHEMLGNRWSAIAAKLPGRTDNEIKNVWHTNLKKRLLEKPSPSDSVSKRVSQQKMKRTHSNSSTITQSEASSFNVSEMESTNSACTTSSSEFSSVTVGESKNMDMNMSIKREDTESLEATVPEIDESFWSEAAIMQENNTTNMMPSKSFSTISNELPLHHQYPFESYGLSSNHDEDGMDFWYDLFIRSVDSTELPEF